VKTEFVAICVNFTPAQAEALRQTAKKYNVTVASLIRAAVSLSTDGYADMLPIMLASKPLVAGRPIGWRGTYRKRKPKRR